MSEFNNFFFIFLLSIFITVPLHAQDESLEISSDSTPTNNTGPGVTTDSFPFIINSDNPTGNTFSTYRPTTTATITLSNQQYTVSQDTDPSSATDPATVFGWDFTEDPSDPEAFIRTGEETDIINSLFSLGLSNPTDSHYTSLQTVTSGTGISTAETGGNYGAWLSTSVEGLRGEILRCGDSDPSCTQNDDNRYHVADLTISFSEPLDNPVLHFLGLGGRWYIDIDDGVGTVTRWSNSGTIELDFVAGSSSSVTAFSKLSGTSNFVIESLDGGTTTSIRNNADYPDINNESTRPEDFGVGSGSVLVDGTGIETLVFQLYMRGINGDEITDNDATDDYDQQIIGSSDLNWAGGSGSLSDDEINFSSDTWMLSFSTQVDPDDTELTDDECFRMLSSPVEGTTYATLLDPIWTQGMTGADYTGGDPNVWLWPDVSGTSDSWTAPGDLGDVIPPGSGFLVSVFDDDDFDGTGDGFSKTLSVTGSENAPLTFTSMNSDASGWTLLGNPFKSTIDWNLLFGESGTQNVEDAVYVYDRDTGSYKSYTSAGGGSGDLTDGLIAPFQGFFVQNSSTSSQVDFTDDVKSSTDGTFYGKENDLNNFVRLELNGESLYNSMWISFSENGSLERTRGDALELMPLASEYAMLGTRKADGTIFDIGHYPVPQEDFEIPVSLETTRSGSFTITATDFDLTFGADLYFIDLKENKSIRIDENFNYQFTLNGVEAAKSGKDMLNSCSVDTSPQKAKTVAEADRFMITTSPKEFQSEMPQSLALNQNYPNPFNPTTQISYELPQQSDVRLEVYDLVGRQVVTLVNQTKEAGIHTVNFDAGNLSSGVYIYRLNAGNTVLSKKLTIIK